MPSYRRHVALHPLALARALRAVRAHAMQTGPGFRGFDTPDLFCTPCGHRHFQNVFCTFALADGPCGCDS
jgi:hypothetical protein